MRNFCLIAVNLDVVPIMHNLFRCDDLWDKHPFRTTFAGTPHQNVSDILIRYSLPGAVRDEVAEDASPSWYSDACRLPTIKPVILDLMRRVEAYELGRVLVTRIPPGGRILRHADDDGRYVQQHGIMRYHVVLQGNPGSLFICGDEQVCMRTGEVWSFRPHLEHEVVNNSNADRVHLIADMTVWPTS